MSLVSMSADWVVVLVFGSVFDVTTYFGRP